VIRATGLLCWPLDSTELFECHEKIKRLMRHRIGAGASGKMQAQAGSGDPGLLPALRSPLTSLSSQLSCTRGGAAFLMGM
jgi:hypothetical protein